MWLQFTKRDTEKPDTETWSDVWDMLRWCRHSQLGKYFHHHALSSLSEMSWKIPFKTKLSSQTFPTSPMFVKSRIVRDWWNSKWRTGCLCRAGNRNLVGWYAQIFCGWCNFCAFLFLGYFSSWRYLISEMTLQRASYKRIAILIYFDAWPQICKKNLSNINNKSDVQPRII